MRSSYAPEDVTLLLKDISGLVTPLPAEIRERKIQSGTHYCEMLPLEYKPSEAYLALYQHALQHYAAPTAHAVEALADMLWRMQGEGLVIVSLARAGIPIGILLRRCIKLKYGADVPHYAISIIRGRGIDKNAIRYILERHTPEQIRFVDGWIGKGAILRQLAEALSDFPEISPELAVVSDPANLTDLCGTHEDILIPSSCLNATVTGLISRTFLRADIIGEDDFHGAAFYGELAEEDLSEEFLRCVTDCFDPAVTYPAPERGAVSGMEIVRSISAEYGIPDINLIKPGIGEATRVLLRRIPWKVLVHADFAKSEELSHIYRLAREKNVPVEVSRVPLGSYKVCGLIRQLSDI